MQDILTCAMGLDVHRDIIVACLVKGAVDAEPEAETRTFSTLIPEMQKLRDWVIESECRNIAILESALLEDWCTLRDSGIEMSEASLTWGKFALSHIISSVFTHTTF